MVRKETQATPTETMHDYRQISKNTSNYPAFALFDPPNKYTTPKTNMDTQNHGFSKR